MFSAVEVARGESSSGRRVTMMPDPSTTYCRPMLAELARRRVVRAAVVVGDAGDEQVRTPEQRRLLLRLQRTAPALAVGVETLDRAERLVEAFVIDIDAATMFRTLPSRPPSAVGVILVRQADQDSSLAGAALRQPRSRCRRPRGSCSGGSSRRRRTSACRSPSPKPRSSACKTSRSVVCGEVKVLLQSRSSSSIGRGRRGAEMVARPPSG